MEFKNKKVVFKPYCQEQEFLLPKNLNDCIPKGHIARLINRIIDNMNIKFVIQTYKGGGTSSYNPKMMLKVWILGFVNKVYSCRLLAKSLRENVVFMWVSGNQEPDFRTLNNFRLRLKEDIKKIFKEIVKYALEKGIIEGKDIFVDHTKREANSNKHKVVWKKQVNNQLNRIDEELDQLFKYIDDLNEKEEKIFGNKDLPEQERDGFNDEKVEEIIDKINTDIKNKKMTNEAGKEYKKRARRIRELVGRKEKYEAKKEVLGKRNSYSRTDNDAVAMMMKDNVTIRPAYNEGIAVENGFVLDYIVSDNCGDCVSFIPLMDGTIDNLGKAPENVNSDGAYGNEENMSYLKNKKIGNFLKYNNYRRENKRNWKEKNKLSGLIYNKENDEFICPGKIKLVFEKWCEEITKTGYKRKAKVYRSERGHCNKCNFHRSKAKTLGLSWKYERLKKQAKSNLSSAKGIELRKKRGNEVESVFGDSKLNKNKVRYNLRGIRKINLEAGLYYLAHNLRKIHDGLENTNKNTKGFI